MTLDDGRAAALMLACGFSLHLQRNVIGQAERRGIGAVQPALTHAQLARARIGGNTGAPRLDLDHRDPQRALNLDALFYREHDFGNHLAIAPDHGPVHRPAPGENTEQLDGACA